jgi:hypothetical protein
MNTTEQEIENVLRSAPRPKPPAGLKERLIEQVRLPVARVGTGTGANGQGQRLWGDRRSWLRRWWPALAPATASLACAVGLVVQQIEIQDLKESVQAMSQPSAGGEAIAPKPAARSEEGAAATDSSTKVHQEIARLKELASQLAAEVAQLEQMRAENAKLRSQLAAPAVGWLTPEEQETLAKAKERAEAIQCSNNMKQLGLAARVWAVDNGDVTPPTILDMTNEMNTPKILVCPGDKGRAAAKDWGSYTTGNCSYEYLAPSAPDTEPERVMFRCPIHGHVGLCDGSVQGGIAKRRPDLLVQRDGKLYLAPAGGPSSSAAPATGHSNQ